MTSLPDLGVAIIGFSGRLPGASDIDAYWQLLCAGRNGGRAFSDRELETMPETAGDPRFVRFGYALENIDRFDAAFFDMSPREASLTDPQHRLFLECAWSAMEHAGYAPGGDTVTGVFAGCNFNTYQFNVADGVTMARPAEFVDVILGNDKDYLATRVSYKLDLRGPSLLVQSACSTSLSAVATAAQALLVGQCDLAVAGASAVRAQQKTGYLAESDSGLSPDGIIRSFSDDAGGMAEGNGVAAVILKRVADAIADGDTIYAVIRGFAVNNDGARKAGFTAPSVSGQAAAIEEALAMANVAPDTVGYIEAHGTGTPIGDPIEISALTQVYGGHRTGLPRIGIGSAKTNIGHLNTAAGIAGLLKATLALHHAAIPPSLNYRAPNPQIDFDHSPFTVIDRLTPWPRGSVPRRAAVSSFGLGGTNVHLVLEEAPLLVDRPVMGAAPHLLMLSARTDSALHAAATRLADALEADPGIDLGDVAHTLNVGRKVFEHRASIVTRNVGEAVEALRTPALRRSRTSWVSRARAITFVFPGAGPQHPGMGASLYREIPSYRDAFDRCADHFDGLLGIRLRDLFAAEGNSGLCGNLSRPREGLPALFATEYALAETLKHWRIAPQALFGHSIGEYVAATISGVFSLETAATIVAARAALIERCPEGGMVAVALDEATLAAMLGPELAIATVNGPGSCVVSGANTALEVCVERLDELGIAWNRLAAERAGHSPLLDSILAEFRSVVSRLTLSEPCIPLISNLSGTWLTAAQAMDPEYWVAQLRHTVRLSDGIEALAADPDRLFLEVGPGRGLSALLRRHPSVGRRRAVVATMRAGDHDGDDQKTLLEAIGQLWRMGMPLDLAGGYYRDTPCRRVPLPTYPFAGERHWIERPVQKTSDTKRSADSADWMFAPTWTRMAEGAAETGDPGRIVLVGDGDGASRSLAAHLRTEGWTVENAATATDLTPLLERLRLSGEVPDCVIHLDVAGRGQSGRTPEESLQAATTQAYLPLIEICRALATCDPAHPIRLIVATRGLCRVMGNEAIDPWRAMVFGPVRVAASELPQVGCTIVDVTHDEPEAGLVIGLARETRRRAGASVPDLIALRGGRCWRQDFVPLTTVASRLPLVREGGSYLVIGGLGGIGLALARHLATQARIRLTLVGRTVAEAGSIPTAAQQSVCDDFAALGAEVLLLRADAGDLAQMRRVIEKIETHFGKLDGVIHAAGVPGGGLMQVGVPRGAASNLPVKVGGLMIIDTLLAGRGLDFLILTSSLGTFTGAVGQADNVAGNAVLDAYAQSGGPDGCWRCLSINWDIWLGVGMIVELGARHERIAGHSLEGLTSEQACAAFDRAVGTGEPQVAVSLKVLPAMLAEMRTRRGQALQRFEQAEMSATAGSRPDLPNSFAPPRDDLDWCLIAIFAERLGIDGIGIDDDFVELGGDSLLAMPVAAQIRDSLAVAFPVAALFRTRSVRLIADVLVATGNAASLRARASALRQVKSMTAEEVHAALNGSRGKLNSGIGA